ncbi:MAG: beta-lactamase family protein [bacterium]|nr:beta-lactamase family protein [bacterium]
MSTLRHAFLAPFAALLLTPAFGQVIDGAPERVDEYMARLERLDFHGLVLVGQGERVLIERGLGMLDREAGTKMPIDAVFTTGSVTKQFTGAACALLASEGRLALDDPLAKWFDDVPEDKAAITIHELLTHTARLPGAVGDDEADTPHAEFLRRVWSSQRMETSGFSYSNVGYTLAALIVEKASGQPYEAFCREHLWEPAGMQRTGYVLPRYTTGELAVGYQDGERWGTVVENAFGSGQPTRHLFGNGGVHSTLRDMLAWHRALLGTEVLNAEAKTQLFAPRVELAPGRHYAYGWDVGTSARGTRYTYHNGGNGWFSFDYMRYTDDDVVVIVASSDPAFPAPLVTPGITRLLFTGGEIPAPPVVREQAADRAGHVGRYVGEGGAAVEVGVDGNALVLAANPAAAAFTRGATSDPRITRANQSTERILDAALKGDFAPWAHAVEEPNVDEVRQRAGGFLAQMESSHGPRKGYAIFASARKPSVVEVVVQFEHQNGQAAVLFGWAGDSLEIIRPTEADAGSKLRCFPLGEGVYTTFALRGARTVRATFADGLTLASEGRELTLRRAD